MEIVADSPSWMASAQLPSLGGFLPTRKKTHDGIQVQILSNTGKVSADAADESAAFIATGVGSTAYSQGPPGERLPA